jgi:hypothetical protein
MVGQRAIPIFILGLLLTTSCGMAQQFQLGSLVPVSTLGTATLIPEPTLTPLGGPLIFSDSPEDLTAADDFPVALYRDDVQGEFRVFYHHRNVNLPSLSVGIAITNISDHSELLMALGSGQGLSIYPDAAGQAALAGFLLTQRFPRFLTELQPNQSYYAVQTALLGETASGLLEFVVARIPDDSMPFPSISNLGRMLRSGSPSDHPGTLRDSDLPPGLHLGTAAVTTVAYEGPQPIDPADLPVVAPGNNTRGTFPHNDRLGHFVVDPSAGLQALPVDSGRTGSGAMPGEYEVGVDAVDGNKQVFDNGNYGVLYDLHIEVRDLEANNVQSVAPDIPIGMLMQPSGGSGQYVMNLPGPRSQPLTSPSVNYKSAWWFYELQPHPARRDFELQTSLPGGSDGPQRLLFAPGFTGE